MRPRLLLATIGLLLPIVGLAQSKLSVTTTPSVLSASGGTMTVAVTIDYGAPINALSVNFVAPSASWTFVSATGPEIPSVYPQTGDTGNVGDGFGFLYITIPPSRARFSFTLRYPARLGDTQPFTASAILVGASGARESLTSTVPLDAASVAPSITTQPQDVSSAPGNTANFSINAAGTGPLAYQWRRNGSPIAGATSATLSFSAVQASDAGTYDTVVTNTAGTVTSRAAQLAVTAGAAAPSFITSAQAASAAVGGSATFSVMATGAPTPTYQWKRLPAGSSTWVNVANGSTYSGATSATLTIANATLAMNGDQFRCVLTNSAGTVTGDAVTLSVSSATPTPAPTSRLTNVSVRARAGTGDETLIVGFVTSGDSAKRVLVRGIGPTLASYGVANALSDPQLKLYTGSTEIAQNDDWGGASALSSVFSAVGAFPLAATAKDAALVNTVPAGAYTGQVSTITGAGVVLVEAYDADAAATASRYVNLSARNQVGTADNILIAGFVIVGTAPKTLLIRGIGPSLAPYGVAGTLADPKLQLYRGSTLIAENDNWGGTSALAAAFTQAGAFSLSSSAKDAALLVTVNPGSYTAQVSGVAGQTGIALVEVYDLK